MAYLDKLVGGVGIGVSPNEGGREVGPPAVVSTAVGVEALESEVLLYPRCVLQCVGFEEGHDVVLDGDVLAAAYRQMLEGVLARANYVADKRDASHGRVAEVQTGQS